MHIDYDDKWINIKKHYDKIYGMLYLKLPSDDEVICVINNWKEEEKVKELLWINQLNLY